MTKQHTFSEMGRMYMYVLEEEKPGYLHGYIVQTLGPVSFQVQLTDT